MAGSLPRPFTGAEGTLKDYVDAALLKHPDDRGLVHASDLHTATFVMFSEEGWSTELDVRWQAIVVVAKRLRQAEEPVTGDEVAAACNTAWQNANILT